MDVQNRIVGVVGRKGSGKSTKMREILERCRRLFVMDPMGEHSWIPNRFSDVRQAYQFLGWASTQQYCAGALIPQRSLEKEFAVLAELVYLSGNLTFGVEEVPMFCQPSYLPPQFDRIVRLGRHRKINLVWTAQRMAEVARRLTAATDVFVLFAHTEPRDLDAIAERCGSEVAKQLAALPVHGYVNWDVLARKLYSGAGVGHGSDAKLLS